MFQQFRDAKGISAALVFVLTIRVCVCAIDLLDNVITERQLIHCVRGQVKFKNLPVQRIQDAIAHLVSNSEIYPVGQQLYKIVD